MIYKIRRIELDNTGEIINERKRCELWSSPHQYRLGALIFARPGKLYRVEEVRMTD